MRATFAGPGVFTAHVPLPARNLFVLSVATNVALHKKIQNLYIGLQAGDTRHKEATAQFLIPLRDVLAALGVTLYTPYLELSKAQVIARGRNMGVPYPLTYSCLLGHTSPCGRCAQCLARTAALTQSSSDKV